MAVTKISGVRQLRISRRLTQAEFARRADISRQAVAAIEAGAYLPNVNVALKVARAFGTTVEESSATRTRKPNGECKRATSSRPRSQPNEIWFASTADAEIERRVELWQQQFPLLKALRRARKGTCASF
jgi:DNA-binding XRE family transcriptional regulator